MDEVQDKIITILRKYAFNKEVLENVSSDAHMIKDLKINSARIVDIVLDIEDEFQIEINNKALQNISTIKDLIEVIEQEQ